MNFAVLGISILMMLAGLPVAGATGAAGQQLDLASHRGEVVVVDFWASWCKPCQKELPWLARMQAQHGKEGLTVLTVNLDRERADADKLLASLGVTLPVVYDPEGSLAEANEIEGMPTSLIYGRDGKLRTTRVGFAPEEEAGFEKILVELLAASKSDAP